MWNGFARIDRRINEKSTTRCNNVCFFFLLSFFWLLCQSEPTQLNNETNSLKKHLIISIVRAIHQINANRCDRLYVRAQRATEKYCNHFFSHHSSKIQNEMILRTNYHETQNQFADAVICMGFFFIRLVRVGCANRCHCSHQCIHGHVYSHNIHFHR